MTPATPPEGEGRAERLVDMFLGQRLESADEPPGLREAVIERVASQADTIRRRGQAQVDRLRSASSRRMPAAYLVDEEILENELQTSAAGIRTARALEGILSDPRRFERKLANRLAPNAQWALRCEASRVPRPPTRASALKWSLPPIPWLESTDAWPPPGAAALDGVRQLRGADGQPVRVAEAPYAGWVQLGLVERQGTLASSHPAIPARNLLVATGFEAYGGLPPANSMALSSSPPNLWATGCDQLAPRIDAEHAQRVLSTAEGPLGALVNYEGQSGAPHRYRGIGLQLLTLVPRIEIVALLGLRPEIPALRHVLVDNDGPALIGRQWHGFLIHDGTYDPLEPAIHGADLLLRSDLFSLLENTVGTDRLALGLLVDYSERSTSLNEPDTDVQ